MVWRVVYTGQRPHYENIALDRVMLELRAEGKIPNTVRFLKFKECVLVGYHQSVEQEVRLSYAREAGVDVGRRITGGGAIYFDQTQIGWEIVADRSFFKGLSFEEITQRICNGVARGLRKMGIDAHFRPRNDIEVKGKKISGTGGVFEGNAFLYQGTLLMDFDVVKMLKLLNIPIEKLTDKGIREARERVSWVKREIGFLPKEEEVFKHLLEGIKEELNIKALWGELTEEELRALEERKNYYKSKEWVFGLRKTGGENLYWGIYRCRGGTLRVGVNLDRSRGVLQEVIINGDLFINPQRIIYDLESYLKHTPVDDLRERVFDFFKDKEFESLNLKVEDFANAIEEVVRKALTGVEKKR